MDYTSHSDTRCLSDCRAPEKQLSLYAPHRDLELVRSTRCRRESAWKALMGRCLPVRIVFPSIRCTPATESTPQNPPPPLTSHRHRQNTRISGLKTAMFCSLRRMSSSWSMPGFSPSTLPSFATCSLSLSLLPGLARRKSRR